MAMIKNYGTMIGGRIEHNFAGDDGVLIENRGSICGTSIQHNVVPTGNSRRRTKKIEKPKSKFETFLKGTTAILSTLGAAVGVAQAGKELLK